MSRNNNKEKKKQKKKNTQEWAIAHSLLIKFSEVFLSKHILVQKRTQILLHLLPAKWCTFQPVYRCIIQNVHTEEPSDDIDIQQFREVIGEITELDELAHRYVRAISATSETEFIHWSALKCLYGEITYYNKQYLLNNGKWYWIDHKFVNKVDNYYKKITLSKTELLEYNHDNEGAYNEALAASKSQYTLMDEKNIMHGGGKSKIEFCDVFSKDKKMIFVKHYGASSVLSHFFQQGMNSAEYLNADPEFRNKLNKVLPPAWQLINPNRRLNTEQFEIIFAIISRDPKDRPDIPFFSKVSLKNVVRRLKGYRYQVTLKKITSSKAD